MIKKQENLMKLSKFYTLSILLCFSLLLSWTGGVLAENNTTTPGNISTVTELNLTGDNPDSLASGISYLQSATSSRNTSQTGVDSMDIQQDTERPEIASGIVHPDTDTDITRSTPTGNPLIPKYALGGVAIDINAHLMEGRDENNISSDLTLHDHTAAQGYIKTVMKDFHYMGGENPS
jgi:hypothetical protein